MIHIILRLYKLTYMSKTYIHRQRQTGREGGRGGNPGREATYSSQRHGPLSSSCRSWSAVETKRTADHLHGPLSSTSWCLTKFPPCHLPTQCSPLFLSIHMIIDIWPLALNKQQWAQTNTGHVNSGQQHPNNTHLHNWGRKKKNRHLKIKARLRIYVWTAVNESTQPNRGWEVQSVHLSLYNFLHLKAVLVPVSRSWLFKEASTIV